ncbi:MAG: hypothetical protein NT028_09205 [candidate division Zixibacteria bacterium]|nr:hypothetical protein [candidate division Zixibacteria bacterium]
MTRYLTILLAVLFAITSLPHSAVAEERKPLPMDSDTIRSSPGQGRAFFVEEDAWVEYMDEQVHEQYFVQAREALAKNDKKEAAQQLGRGVLYMRMEGGRASKEAKPILKQSELILKHMVDGLKSGTTPTLTALDSAYARANYALALHHYLNAKENWVDRAGNVVGHDLKATANELRFAIVWSGQTLSESTKQTLYDVAVVGEAMADNSDYTNDDVDKSIATMGQQVDLVGKNPAFAR